MDELVKVYMKEACPYSRGLIRKLKHDGVSYVTYDVQEDRVRLAEMLAVNGGRRAVPTIVWPDKGVEVGFRGT
jgi:glutaredoxin